MDLSAEINVLEVCSECEIDCGLWTRRRQVPCIRGDGPDAPHKVTGREYFSLRVAWELCPRGWPGAGVSWVLLSKERGGEECPVTNLCEISGSMYAALCM